MSQVLESESDDESTSSATDNVPSGNNSFLVHNELEFFTRKLNQFGLESDDDADITGDLDQSNIKVGDAKREYIVKQLTPSTSSTSVGRAASPNDEFTKPVSSGIEQPPLKVQIKFQSIGSIRQIIPQGAKISASQPFSVIMTFLRKKLKVDTVYCYINNSFAPAPEQTVGDLWNQFKVQKELVVNYCSTVAFG